MTCCFTGSSMSYFSLVITAHKLLITANSSTGFRYNVLLTFFLAKLQEKYFIFMTHCFITCKQNLPVYHNHFKRDDQNQMELVAIIYGVFFVCSSFTHFKYFLTSKTCSCIIPSIDLLPKPMSFKHFNVNLRISCQSFPSSKPIPVYYCNITLFPVKQYMLHMYVDL